MHLKHGHTRRNIGKSAEYQAWSNMACRCNNPRHPGFADYGGRGITICIRWRGEDGFANFLADMGPRPSAKHSIDRYPNNDGNYEPSNCRWATQAEQLNNTRRNRFIVHAGQRLTIQQWATNLCVSEEALRSRLKKGWEPSLALTTPFVQKRTDTSVTHKGETRTIAEWAKVTGIDRRKLHWRIFQKQWPLERAFCDHDGKQTRTDGLGKNATIFITFRGKTKGVAEWSSETGISKQAIRTRLRKGWPIKRVLTEPAYQGGKH